MSILNDVPVAVSEICAEILAIEEEKFDDSDGISRVIIGEKIDGEKIDAEKIDGEKIIGEKIDGTVYGIFVEKSVLQNFKYEMFVVV